MQDLENNAQKQQLGSGNKAHSDHPFDKEIRERLADAAQTPAPHLMDDIFARLDAEKAKDGAIGDKKEPTEAQHERQNNMTVRPLSRFRLKMSQAAAIAAILVALWVGIKKLSNQNAVPLTSATLTALNAERDADTAKRTGVTAKTPTQPPATRTVAASSRAEAPQMKSSPTKEDASGRLTSVNEGKSPYPNSSGSGTRNAPSGQKEGPHLNLVAKAEPVTPLEQQPSSMSETTAKIAAAAQTGIQRDPVTVAKADESGTGRMDENQALAANTVPEVVDAGRGQSDQVAITDTKKGSAKPERRGGLLKGVLKKIGKSARAITEEVVTQDEDKTVINVGILAITTYR